MIDIALLRERRAELAASLARRGADFDLDLLADLDTRRRATRSQAEELRARQKESGKSISKLSGDEKTQAIAEAGKLSEDYKRLLTEADELDEQFNDIWIQLPNMTDPTAADGLEEEDAIELYRVGAVPQFDFEVRDHVELGDALDVVDIERATKISGSRFGMIKGCLLYTSDAADDLLQV